MLALSAIRNNDKVGLILFTDRVEHFIAPQKGRNRALQVIRDMLVFEPAGRGRTSGARSHLHKVCRRRSVAFLISDFLARDYEGRCAWCTSGTTWCRSASPIPARWRCPISA